MQYKKNKRIKTIIINQIFNVQLYNSVIESANKIIGMNEILN